MPKGIDSTRSDRSHVALPPLSRQADSSPQAVEQFRAVRVTESACCQRAKSKESRVQMKDENEVSTVIQTAQPPIGGCERYIYAKGLFVAILFQLCLYSVDCAKKSILESIAYL